MRNNILAWIVLLSTAFISTSFASAQGFPVDAFADGKADSGYQTKWDSTHNRLLLYRDVSSPNISAARIFQSDGSSTGIYLLRDFPDAKFTDVWAAAATPGGGMVLSVTLGFGERPDPKNLVKTLPPIQSLLLTYDSHGALKKVWNVAPYQHQDLAVDLAGDVFALGRRDAGPEGFPMIIKYSPSGKVVGEYVSSTMFAAGAKALDGDGLNGSPALFLRNQQLLLWVPSTREAFRFSVDGKLERKIPIGSTLDRLAKQSGFVRATVGALAVTNSSNLLAQVRFWPATNTAQGIMLGMTAFPLDGSEAKLQGTLTAAAGNRQRFLGIDENGKRVVLEHAGKGQGFLRKDP